MMRRLKGSKAQRLAVFACQAGTTAVHTSITALARARSLTCLAAATATMHSHRPWRFCSRRRWRAAPAVACSGCPVASSEWAAALSHRWHGWAWGCWDGGGGKQAPGA